MPPHRGLPGSGRWRQLFGARVMPVSGLCPLVAEPARAAPVPAPNIHPAAGKRKGSLALFTADRSAPRGSLGCAAGDPQRPGGIRVALAPRRPGLPPRPVRPTRGAWPGARLRAAPCGPRASAGAASRASSGPFEVEARPQRSPSVLPRATLTERPPWADPSHPRFEEELQSRVRLEPEYPFRAEAARYQLGSHALSTGPVAALVGGPPGEFRDPQRPSRRLGG